MHTVTKFHFGKETNREEGGFRETNFYFYSANTKIVTRGQILEFEVSYNPIEVHFMMLVYKIKLPVHSFFLVKKYNKGSMIYLYTSKNHHQ